MTAPKTSPLPWSLAIGTKDKLIDSNGYLVTHIDGPNFLIDETNARFIVTAVNSHEELLEAAKGALVVMNNSKIVTADATTYWIEFARAAIAKAEATQ